jgi:hypothetical protein
MVGRPFTRRRCSPNAVKLRGFHCMLAALRHHRAAAADQLGLLFSEPQILAPHVSGKNTLTGTSQAAAFLLPLPFLDRGGGRFLAWYTHVRFSSCRLPSIACGSAAAGALSVPANASGIIAPNKSSFGAFVGSRRTITVSGRQAERRIAGTDNLRVSAYT